MILLAFNILTSGVPLSMVCAVIGLAAAFFLIGAVVRSPAGNERMREIAGAVQEGAKAYLNRQVITISSIAVIIFILLFIFKDRPTAIGFVIGAFCSLSAGFIGMRIAVVANVRTTQAATESIHKALRMAFNGGAVTGLLVVGLALLSVSIFYTLVTHIAGARMAINSLVGLALGASLISVFARLGGGIYTKAADVGADLVGKIEQGLEEDDPRNPATIADNVGDNVGDCAGMAADVFETYAVSLIGAILVGALTLPDNPAAVVYPFVLGGISVLGAILGVLFVNFAGGKPANVLMGGVITSAIVSAVLFWPATHYLFRTGVMIGGVMRSPTQLYWASLVGIVMTAVVVVITNYYTSMHYRPVQKIARASETGHATNIIAGLAVGQHATALPVGFIAIAILLSFHFGGLYGIAIAVMAMLSMAGIIISLDSFGPITDNAGGIAVMSKLPNEVRNVTDQLDAVGNTMKAVTKGLRHCFSRPRSARFIWLIRTGAQRTRDPQWPAVRVRVFAYRSEGDYRFVPRWLAPLHLHRVQHGRSRQSRRRRCPRGAAATAGASRHHDWEGHTRVRHMCRHRDQSGIARNDCASAAAVDFRGGGGGDSAAGPGRARGITGGHDRHRLVCCHCHDLERRRMGQCEKIYRGRKSRRQRLFCSRRSDHRRHRR